jgi:hypothetical protein
MCASHHHDRPPLEQPALPTRGARDKKDQDQRCPSGKDEKSSREFRFSFFEQTKSGAVQRRCTIAGSELKQACGV